MTTSGEPGAARPPAAEGAATLLADVRTVADERRQLLAELRDACASGDREGAFEIAAKLVGLSE